MPHSAFKGIINVRERDHVLFDPWFQQGLFNVNGSLEKHRSALPWFVFGDVGSAEEFLQGELWPCWGGQGGMALYPGCLHPWNAGKTNLPSSGSWEDPSPQMEVHVRASCPAGVVQVLTPISFIPQSTSTFLGECD